ncbi:hypothetical protein ACYQR9_03675 [Methylobacterium sp. CM6241]
MRRTILTTILLSAIGAPAMAQTTKGAPPALIGHYGNSPAQCRSYNRKTDDVRSIERDTYTFCGGSSCEAKIVSTTKTASGYKLKTIGTFSGVESTDQFREIAPGVFEIPGVAGRRQTIVRCTSKDIVAGIGLEPNTEGQVTNSLSAVFTAHYAEHVTTLCPSTALNEGLAKQIIATGIDAWEAHLKRYGLRPGASAKEIRQGAEYDVRREKGEATYAAKQDAEALPNFCEEVMRAFGDGARVVPGLVIDQRKKA